MKVRRQAVIVWLCPSSMAAPAGASTQSLPTLSGVSSRGRDLQRASSGHVERPEKAVFFPTCCVGLSLGLYWVRSRFANYLSPE